MTYEEKKTKATELRKSQNFVDALVLYRELYSEVDDKYNLSGLLNCLRKTDNLEEAVQLAEKVKNKYLDFEWFRNEIIWTLIQGKLLKISDDDLNKIVEVANIILEIKPDELARVITIFRVLKVAKNTGNWETILTWSSMLDVNSLDDTPMVDEKGREGWSKKSLWYNYRINALIEFGQYDEAEVLCDPAIKTYPKLKKFFIRLKGIVLVKKGNMVEAKNSYEELIKSINPDWWLLHEYGKVLSFNGELELALKKFYLAASKSYKLENSVKLFSDIANICIELERYEEAAAHIFLTKYLRESKGWSIPAQVEDTFSRLKSKNIEMNYPDLRSSLKVCKEFWNPSNQETPQNQNNKKCVGVLSTHLDTQPFAFIVTKEFGKIFCWKKDLPQSAKNGTKLQFDKIKSFDKKKNIDSWRAINIKEVIDTQ